MRAVDALRRALERDLLDLIAQHEVRGDWTWAAWWRERWVGLAMAPDAVLPSYARELDQLCTAERRSLCQ